MEEGYRRGVYGNVDAEYNAAMEKMRGGSFKFDKKKRSE